MDSAARAHNRSGSKTLQCGRCFAVVPAEANYCAECGAPISHQDPCGSDSIVEQELAQANLHRVRGEFKQAEEQCLTILRRLPNNVTANALLGDLAMDRGEFSQAAEWYELALDLNPHSLPIQQKLVDAKRLSDPDVALPGLEAARVAGPRTKLPVWAWASVLGIVILLAVAAKLPRGGTNSATDGEGKVIRSDIVAPTQGPSEPVSAADDVGRPTPVPGIAEDQGWLTQLASLLPDERLLVATHDPRTKVVYLTFEAGPSPAEQASNLCRTLLTQMGSIQGLTVRGVRDGKTVFLADADRDRLPPTDAPNPAPSEFLTSIWPSAEAPTSSP